MTSCPHEHEDAAYVLGALSPEERVAFERHLSTCAECARSVRELAGLPGLLARVPVEMIDPHDPPAPVPDTLLPGLVRRANALQRRRTWVTSALVGAAAAAVTLGVGYLGYSQHEHGRDNPPVVAPQIAPARVMHPVGGTYPVKMSVSLTSVGWGTRLDLTCAEIAATQASQTSGSTDNDSGAKHDWSSYSVYVTTRDGSSEELASWKPQPGTVTISGATSVDRKDITDVQVKTADGATIFDLGA